MENNKMTKGVKIFAIISGVVLALTVFYCLYCFFDIIATITLEAGSSFNKIGYVFVIIFGLFGGGISLIMSIIGLFIGVSKTQKSTIITFAIYALIIILFAIFVCVIGPNILNSI